MGGGPSKTVTNEEVLSGASREEALSDHAPPPSYEEAVASAGEDEDRTMSCVLSFLGPDLVSADLMDTVGALGDLRNLGLVDTRYSRHCRRELEVLGRRCVDRSSTELRVATGGHRSEATLLYRATLLSGSRDYALTKAEDVSGRLLSVLADETCRPCQRCAGLGLKALVAAGHALGPKDLRLLCDLLGTRPNYRFGLLGGITTTDVRHRLVIHRDFRSGVFVDLVYLLHHLFYDLRYLGRGFSKPRHNCFQNFWHIFPCL
jgi:hypothetical protein